MAWGALRFYAFSTGPLICTMAALASARIATSGKQPDQPRLSKVSSSALPCPRWPPSCMSPGLHMPPIVHIYTGPASQRRWRSSHRFNAYDPPGKPASHLLQPAALSAPLSAARRAQRNPGSMQLHAACTCAWAGLVVGRVLTFCCPFAARSGGRSV